METTVRTVYEVTVEEQGEEIVIRVSGNGFLYNMVRIIAGTLMEVGKGKWEPEKIKEILAACDRKAAGPTAPHAGFCLQNMNFWNLPRQKEYALKCRGNMCSKSEKICFLRLDSERQIAYNISLWQCVSYEAKAPAT